MKLRMVHNIDPITGKDLGDVRDLPNVVEETSDGELTIYFESEETKQAYLDMPTEDSSPDPNPLPLNPVDAANDEG